MPVPSFVMTAEVLAATSNSSAAKRMTAVKGVSSSTFTILYGSFGSEANVILNVTLAWLAGAEGAEEGADLIDGKKEMIPFAINSRSGLLFCSMTLSKASKG